MEKREPILFFDADQEWLQMQPVMAAWSDGTIVLLARIKERLERYLKPIDNELINRLHRDPERLEPYINRIWRCFSYHWRDAIGQIRENSSIDRLVQAQASINGDEVLEQIEASKGFSAKGNLQGNPIQDVVLVEALLRKVEKAPKAFEKQFQQPLVTAGLRYAAMKEEPMLASSERWWQPFCDFILEQEINGKAKLDEYTGRTGLLIWLKLALHEFLWETIRNDSFARLSTPTLEEINQAEKEKEVEKEEGGDEETEDAEEKGPRLTRKLMEDIKNGLSEMGSHTLLVTRLHALEVPDAYIVATLGLPISAIRAPKSAAENSLKHIYTANGQVFDFNSSQVKKELDEVMRSEALPLSPGQISRHPLASRGMIARLSIGELNETDRGVFITHLATCHNCAEEFAKMLKSGLLRLPVIRNQKTQKRKGKREGTHQKNVFAAFIAGIFVVIMVALVIMTLLSGSELFTGTPSGPTISVMNPDAELVHPSLEDYGYREDGTRNPAENAAPIIDNDRDERYTNDLESELHKRNIEMILEYGEFLLGQHRWDDAQCQFEIANIQLEERSAEPITGLGIALFEKAVRRGKMPTEAESYFSRAVNLKSYDPIVHINMGICYARLGKHEKAKACFEKAFQLSRSEDDDEE